MVAPPGLSSIQPGQVCKLKMAYMALTKLAGGGLLNYQPFLFLRDILNLCMIIPYSFILLKDLLQHYWYMWTT